MSRTSLTAHVAICGGGVIGLSIAIKLASDGHSVTVIDNDQPGRATTAAAGMLAPLAEASASNAGATLGVESLKLWPEFLGALKELGGDPPSQRGGGIIRPAADEKQAHKLRDMMSWQSTTGLPVSWLTPSDVSCIQPGLRRDIAGATLSSAEKHIDPRHLYESLLFCARIVKVRLLEASVISFTERESTVAVDTSAGTVECDRAVVANGAWVRDLLPRFRSSIRPIRGQIVRLASPAAGNLKFTIHTHAGYLVPRSTGDIDIGATQELALDYEPSTSAADQNHLLAMATSWYPELSASAVRGTWAGIRPVSKDGLPLLGGSPDHVNVSVAIGHGRNGILLAPLTAKLMCDYIINDTPIVHDLSPRRFELI